MLWRAQGEWLPGKTLLSHLQKRREIFAPFLQVHITKLA
jgi:hypothetical protein